MPNFSKEQKEKLVVAVKSYRTALKKREAADADLAEKLNHLKVASQASGQGPAVLDEAMKALGQFYLDAPTED